MDIKILDSWLREHLETNAKPLDIAKAMSLTSASIERVEPYGQDFVYSAEITTNRVDMASVRGLAREAATVLPHFGFKAKLLPLKLVPVKKEHTDDVPLTIKVDEKLVNRICGVVLEVKKGESPKFVRDRLEAAGIRSLNNLIDVTNYIMLEIGHPSHAFDYDRLTNHTLIIRESKKGETIVTLDKKQHILPGGDIVADNGEGKIVDLLGVMGTDNSVVTDTTSRILFFFDNNDPWKIRKTSMGLAIRTEAAALNEKGIDPELAMEALLRGVTIYKEIADAKVISDVIDIYPHRPTQHTVMVHNATIQRIIGVEISLKTSMTILESLGFGVKATDDTLAVTVPTWREKDVTIEEDVVEEVARIYGYHNIPAALPPFTQTIPYHQNQNPFYWETRVKEMMKDWGFTEAYTYSTVSETMFEGPLEEAITLKNPLDQDHVYLRKTLTPSLLQVISDNKSYPNVQVFEIANTYHKRKKDLPKEIRTLGLVIKGKSGTFYHAKGIIESLTQEMGIKNLTFSDTEVGGIGASMYIGKAHVGDIEVMDEHLVTLEVNFDELLALANIRKTFVPLPKYPPMTEDITLVVENTVKTGDILEEIKKVSPLITAVELLDMYGNTRTFHIVYLDRQKNLTTEEVAKVREQIIATMSKKFTAKIK